MGRAGHLADHDARGELDPLLINDPPAGGPILNELGDTTDPTCLLGPVLDRPPLPARRPRDDALLRREEAPVSPDCRGLLAHPKTHGEFLQTDDVKIH